METAITSATSESRTDIAWPAAMGNALIEDRRHEQLAVAEDSDDPGEPVVEEPRRPVADIDEPEVASRRRKDDPQKHLEELDQEERVQIERLPDADDAELPEEEQRDQIAGGPGQRNDRRVDRGGHDDEKGPPKESGLLGIAADAPEEPHGEPAQDEVDEIGRGDGERDVADGDSEHMHLVGPERRQAGRRQGQLADECLRRTRRALRDGLRELGDLALRPRRCPRSASPGPTSRRRPARRIRSAFSSASMSFCLRLVVLDRVDQRLDLLVLGGWPSGAGAVADCAGRQAPPTRCTGRAERRPMPAERQRTSSSEKRGSSIGLFVIAWTRAAERPL